MIHPISRHFNTQPPSDQHYLNAISLQSEQGHKENDPRSIKHYSPRSTLLLPHHTNNLLLIDSKPPTWDTLNCLCPDSVVIRTPSLLINLDIASWSQYHGYLLSKGERGVQLLNPSGNSPSNYLIILYMTHNY